MSSEAEDKQTITVDIAQAVAQLQASPELASMIMELVAPSAAQDVAKLEALCTELLAALKGLVDPDLTYSGANIIIPTETHGDAIRLVREARAAIAKAESAS